MTHRPTQCRSGRRRARIVAVGAALVAAAVGLSACGSDRQVPGPVTTVTASNHAGASSSASSSKAAASSSVSTPTGKPVQVISSVISDGSTFGVGLPIILLMSRQISDAAAFQKATVVKVNGKVVNGNWYFERRYQIPGYPVEADYRTQSYWPGHAHITMDLPVKGVSAGPGLYFQDSLTLSFFTGPSNIVTVDNYTHTLTYVRDGRTVETFPVSLGYPNTPTARGIKVIMEKGRSICMSGPGYHVCDVQNTQRLTYGGEYLHAAPWNCLGAPGCKGPENNIGHGNSSNGCTNLTPDDAATLYNQLEIGDVVRYPNADGPLMQMGDGYGDWNVPWGQWQTGGLYPIS